MPNPLPEYGRELLRAPYYREQAVEYAHYWAYRRNPNYYGFDQIGGDCTNFVSQALFYANGVMNFTPTYGWYYISLDDRTPSWSGVEYLYNFLTTNMGPGPFGHEVPLSELEPGDIIQMAIKQPDTFGHTVLVTRLLSDYPEPDSILVAAHDQDSACRPVSTYAYHMIRAIRIDGVRYLSAGTDLPSPAPQPSAAPSAPSVPETVSLPGAGAEPAFEGEPSAVG
jgi:hypothetical protein